MPISDTDVIWVTNPKMSLMERLYLPAIFSGIETTVPQAVTLDISLPDGSGIEVLKHIQKRGWNLLVVVLTGNLYEALQAKCWQLGAAAVLDKLNGLAPAAEALLAGPARSTNALEK